jgi:hypothetical protein
MIREGVSKATGHSVLVSHRFRKRSVASSSNSNIIGRQPFERYLAFLKNTTHIFDEKHLWDVWIAMHDSAPSVLLISARTIIPYPTGRFSGWALSQALRARLQSHCPSGTKYILRAETLIRLALMDLNPPG